MRAVRHAVAGLASALLLTTTGGSLPAAAAPAAAASAAVEPAVVEPAAAEPAVAVDERRADTGDSVAVTGTGWSREALVTLLLCGQNAFGGTEACANADGRSTTTDSRGRFRLALPVAEPPKPCPCVVKAVAVTGEHATADTEFEVAGHPVEPLPTTRGGAERLSVLSAKLEGEGGLPQWFGAAQQRRLVLEVANQGSGPATDPVFQVGTAEGVLAPRWTDQRWRGRLAPGETQQVVLPVELPTGAHGEYRVSARYGQTVLAEQPWQVGRPWGLTLLWLLLLLAVPYALFRVGRFALRRLAPRERVRATRPVGALVRLRDRLEEYAEPADDGTGPPPPRRRWRKARNGPPLPWLAPDDDPSPRSGDEPPARTAAERAGGG